MTRSTIREMFLQPQIPKTPRPQGSRRLVFGVFRIEILEQPQAFSPVSGFSQALSQ